MAIRFKPTDEQLAVIEHEGSHALVSAVAGAGKSTTMVEHIARRVEAGVDPKRILAIQYNKSAQLTMQRKLKQRLDGAEAPQARTFHSIGNAMLKRLIDVGALAPAKFVDDPSVYDRLVRTSLRDQWRESHGREAYPTQEQMEGFQQFVMRAKADTRSPADVFRTGGYHIECQPYVAAFKRMDHEARRMRVYFFDDMLSLTYQTLLEDPSLWDLFSQRMEMLLVDEAQDMNPVQYALLHGIVGTRATCMAIGDPDQAIYSFRGADMSILMHKFPRDYAPCTIYRMTNSFRYGHETSMVANHIITKNLDRDDKITIAAPGNPDTRVTLLPQEPNKPSGIISRLEEAHRNGTLRKNAMLVRYYSQSVPYEIELAVAGVPFHVYGREPLLMIPEIASLVAAMSLAADHWVVPDALQVRFLTALLRSPTIFATNELINQAGVMMGDAMARGEPASAALFRLSGSDKVKEDRLRQRLRKRADVVQLLEAGGMRRKTPKHVIDAYLSFTDFRGVLGAGSASQAQADEIEQNINAFKLMAQGYPTLHEFLDALGPLAAHTKDKPPEHDHLGILSMHRAKGMEWPRVFLPGWSAAAFPREHEEIEEERRLAYVAVTRAIDELFFLYPKDESLAGEIATLDAMPEHGSKYAASKFMYEGEIGLSLRVADAIREGREEHISCRRMDVANRYVEEAGIEGIEASVPPALAERLSQTEFNTQLKVEPGQRLRNANMLYEVTQKLGDRYFYVKSLAGGDPRLISLDEPGWSLA